MPVPDPGGAAEVVAVAARLRVSEAQVAHDRLISHVLAALAQAAFPISFYGGTALCRSYLEGSRLSEDVDLLHDAPAEALAALGALWAHALRREYPGVSLTRSHREGDGIVAFLETAAGHHLKVFVGNSHRYQRGWRFSATAVPSATPGCRPPLRFRAPPWPPSWP